MTVRLMRMFLGRRWHGTMYFSAGTTFNQIQRVIDDPCREKRFEVLFDSFHAAR